MNKLLKALTAGVTAVLLGSVITVSTGVVTADVAVAAGSKAAQKQNRRNNKLIKRHERRQGFIGGRRAYEKRSPLKQRSRRTSELRLRKAKNR